MRRVIRVVQDQRDARYNLLRGYFRGADDDTSDELDESRLTSVSLLPGGIPSGKKLGTLELDAIGVRVVNVRRNSGHTLTADDTTTLEDGDTLVLSGKPQALARAEEILLRPNL